MRKKIMKSGMCMAMAVLLMTASIRQVSFAKSTQEERIEADMIQVNASKDEVDATGTVLTLNQAVTNQLSDKEEEQWYKFEITETGHFKLSLSVNAATDVNNINYGWKMSLYRSTDMQNAVKTVSGITSVGSTDELVLGMGIYYVMVCSQSNYMSSVAPLGCKYDLSVNFTPDASFEKEGNDTSDKCEPIAVNTLCKGSLYSKDDEDWYMVELTDSAKLQVILKEDSSTNVNALNDGWKMNIYDSKFTLVKTYSDIKSETASAVLPYQKGKYYIQIVASSNYIDSWVPMDCIYNLTVNATHADDWEAEYNDSNTTANVIKADTTYSGTLYKEDDEDWYKVTIDKSGYFQLIFDAHLDKNIGKINHGWKLTLYDADLNVIREFTRIEEDMESIQIPYGLGTYYIKIKASSDWDSSVAPVDQEYSFILKQTKSTSWETENNNTRQTANKISVNKTYNGYLEKESAEDWYQFTMSKKGTVKVTLGINKNTNVDTIHNGWNVYIYKKNSANEMQSVKSITTTDAMTIALEKGTYYLKVVAYSDWSSSVAPVDSIYDLSVKCATAPAAAKIKSVKAGKKQATIKWGKVNGATGYYVYRSASKNGTYKKVATVKKASTTSYTDKKSLVSNKQYYYKIISYNTANGVTAKSSASTAKSVKVK